VFFSVGSEDSAFFERVFELGALSNAKAGHVPSIEK
jgi:hypothetical protein